MLVNFEDALDISGNINNSGKLTQLTEPKYSRWEKETFICYQSSCKYEGKSKSSLKLHEKSHKDYKNKIACEYCKFVTKRQVNYTMHLKTEHNEIKLNVVEQCDWPECDFASHRKGNLPRHRKIHQTLSCSQCVFTTDKSIILIKHINRQHRKRSYIYDTCGKALLSADNLRIHKNKRNKKIKLQCNICPRKTYQLQTHYNRTHGHKMVYCQYCNFKTSYPNLLKSHSNKIHSEAPLNTTNITNPDCEQILLKDNGAQINVYSIMVSSGPMPLNHDRKQMEGQDTNILPTLKSETVFNERYDQQHKETKLLLVLHKDIKFISKESKQLDNHSSLNTPEIGKDLKKENSRVANSLEGVVLVDNFKEHDAIIPYVASQEKLNNSDKIYKEEEVSQRSSDHEPFSKGKNLYDCDMPMCTYKGKTKDLLRSQKARHKKNL